MYAKWALAPSGYYIGVVVFNNKHYYSYGRTANHLESNIKTRLYQMERVSQTQVHLEQQMSDEIDLTYASNIFKSKFVKPRPNERPIVANNILMSAPKPPVEYLCEEKDGEMIVYEVKEIMRYKMHKAQIKTPDFVVPVKDSIDQGE